jgi:hypothetical protein
MLPLPPIASSLQNVSCLVVSDNRTVVDVANVGNTNKDLTDVLNHLSTTNT